VVCAWNVGWYDSDEAEQEANDGGVMACLGFLEMMLSLPSACTPPAPPDSHSSLLATASTTIATSRFTIVPPCPSVKQATTLASPTSVIINYKQ